MENVEILFDRAVLVLIFFTSYIILGSTLLVEGKALIRILILFVVDIVEFVELFVFYDLIITSVLHAEISDL